MDLIRRTSPFTCVAPCLVLCAGPHVPGLHPEPRVVGWDEHRPASMGGNADAVPARAHAVTVRQRWVRTVRISDFMGSRTYTSGLSFGPPVTCRRQDRLEA